MDIYNLLKTNKQKIQTNDNKKNRYLLEDTKIFKYMIEMKYHSGMNADTHSSMEIDKNVDTDDDDSNMNDKTINQQSKSFQSRPIEVYHT